MKTILFDLSDVLIKGLEGTEYKLAQALNKPVKTVFKGLFDFNYRPFWLGDISESEVLRQLIEKNNWPISEESLKTFIYDNFKEVKGTRKLIKSLKNKYQLILLSVNPPEWVRYLENNYSYRSLFDYVYYSYEIKFTKREPEAFQYVLKKHNLDPKETLLIDDSTRNINIAQTLGIIGIKFLSADQMKKELENRSLL